MMLNRIGWQGYEGRTPADLITSFTDPETPGQQFYAAALGLSPGGNGVKLYVEALSGSTSIVPITISAEIEGNKWSGTVTDVVHVLPVSANLTAYRPQHGADYGPFARTAVVEESEEDAALGAGIRINNGDTDPNGEDDLIEVTIERGSDDVPLVFGRSSTALKVYRNRDATDEIIFTSNKAEIPFEEGLDSLTVWVEWSEANHGTADLTVETLDSFTVVDTIKFHTFQSIVVALGGLNQVPNEPVDPNHGAFQIGVDLYDQGYDVWMWDEDNVTGDGTGTPYDEVITATATRQVQQVAVYGYSRGGGAAFDMIGALNTQGINVRFSGYIDAVESGFIDSDPESRRPIGSLFHINYYQTLGALHGEATDGLLGGDVEVDATTWFLPSVTHFTIDDDGRTRNAYVDAITGRVTR